MILDASVAIKWLLKGEDYEQEALTLLRRHIEKKESITVPPLIFLEIANTLATKSGLSQSQIHKSLKLVFQTDLTIYQPNHEDITVSAKLAKQYKTSVYDMLYAVIAEAKKTTLVTADEAFIRKTNFPYVKHIKSIPAS